MASIVDRIRSHIRDEDQDWGVASWTRFTLPLSQSLDWKSHSMRILVEDYGHGGLVYLGRIEESLQECLLLMRWYSYETCTTALNSHLWYETLEELRGGSTKEPETVIVQFTGSEFLKGTPMRPEKVPWMYLEIRTAYFRSTITDPEILAIWQSVGVPALYRSVANPHAGFSLEYMRYGDEEILLCIWIQHWKDPYHEYKYKFHHAPNAKIKIGGTERVVSADGGFLHALREFGALGSSLCHVRFDVLEKRSW